MDEQFPLTTLGCIAKLELQTPSKTKKAELRSAYSLSIIVTVE